MLVYKVGDLMLRYFISQIGLSYSLYSHHQPPALSCLGECGVLDMSGFKASHKEDW